MADKQLSFQCMYGYETEPDLNVVARTLIFMFHGEDVLATARAFRESEEFIINRLKTKAAHKQAYIDFLRQQKADYVALVEKLDVERKQFDMEEYLEDPECLVPEENLQNLTTRLTGIRNKIAELESTFEMTFSFFDKFITALEEETKKIAEQETGVSVYSIGNAYSGINFTKEAGINTSLLSDDALRYFAETRNERGYLTEPFELRVKGATAFTTAPLTILITENRLFPCKVVTFENYLEARTCEPNELQDDGELSPSVSIAKYPVAFPASAYVKVAAKMNGMIDFVTHFRTNGQISFKVDISRQMLSAISQLNKKPIWTLRELNDEDYELVMNISTK